APIPGVVIPGGMSELADEHDLGSCAARRVGSSPTSPTTYGTMVKWRVLVESGQETPVQPSFHAAYVHGRCRVRSTRVRGHRLGIVGGAYARGRQFPSQCCLEYGSGESPGTRRVVARARRAADTLRCPVS